MLNLKQYSNKEATKKEVLLLEVQGFLQSKALFQLEEALRLVKARKPSKQYNNIYIIN
jgi:hypothetical protein